MKREAKFRHRETLGDTKSLKATHRRQGDATAATAESAATKAAAARAYALKSRTA